MKRKIFILAFLSIFLITSTGALSFHLEVSALAKVDESFLRYNNSTGLVQDIRLNVKNTGSIGCVYRLKGVFYYKNKSHVRYSDPYPLWPQETENVRLSFLAENYTGKVKTSLYSTYCDRQKFYKNITFTNTKPNKVNQTIKSTTIDVNRNNATIKLPINKGRLIPGDTPPYWKTSAAKIKDKEANIQYNPPIFDSDEKLNYTIISEGKILGETTIKLNQKIGYWESLQNKISRILAIMLLFSIILNTRLLFDRLRRN